jgi:hypothetical protein
VPPAPADVDAGLNVANWSGACWNPDTRTLWLACKQRLFSGRGRKRRRAFPRGHQRRGRKGQVVARRRFRRHLPDRRESNRVYVMDENGYIRENDVSNYAVTNATASGTSPHLPPEVGGSSGGEGIAFVPDDYLRRQHFCDSNGVAYVSTTAWAA